MRSRNLRLLLLMVLAGGGTLQVACDPGPTPPDAGRPDASETEDASVPPLTIGNLGPHVVGSGELVELRLEADGGTPEYRWVEVAKVPALYWADFEAPYGLIRGYAKEDTVGAKALRVRLIDSQDASVEADVLIDVNPCIDGTPGPCPYSGDGICVIGEAICDGGVRDTQNQCGVPSTGTYPSDNFSMCGNGCLPCDPAVAQSCRDGACSCGAEPACDGGEGCCFTDGDHRCVDYRTDVANCGGCSGDGQEFRCQAGLYDNTSVSCADGGCAYACVAPYDRCNQADPSQNGDCLTNTATDVQHCGECGYACPAPDAGSDTGVGKCDGGGCRFDCGAEGNLCGGNTCQLKSDPNHCGGCGKTCLDTSLNVATASCSSQGVCSGTCDPGFGNCDEDWGDGCEVEFSSNNQHCGGCNQPCGSGYNCSVGQCRMACGGGFSCTEPQQCVDVSDQCEPPPIPCIEWSCE